MIVSPVIGRTLGLLVNLTALVAPPLGRRFAAYVWFTPFPFSRRSRERVPDGAEPVSLETRRGAVRGYTLGNGDSIALLVHGWAGSSVQYRHLAKRLAENGYRAIAIDLPAHGRTAGRQTDVFEIADVIEAAAEALGGVDLVVAHSLGALATAVAAHGALEARRVAFVGPAVRPRHALEVLAHELSLTRRVVRFISDEMKLRFGEDVWDRVPQQMLAVSPSVGAIVHGAEDAMVSADDVEGLARVWGVPLSETEGEDHNSVLKAGPALDHIIELALRPVTAAA